jgi:hypothetical protein
MSTLEKDGRLSVIFIRGKALLPRAGECGFLELRRTDKVDRIEVSLKDNVSGIKHHIRLDTEGITTLKETCERLLREGM